MEGLLAFAGVSLIVIVTPGPDTALTLRNTLLGGRTAGLASGLGIASGQVLWALATAAGVAALLAASEPLLNAVRLGAFAALLGLGVLFAAMTATWLALYAVVAGALRSVLARGRVRRAIEAVTGAVLIGLGVRVATEAR